MFLRFWRHREKMFCFYVKLFSCFAFCVTFFNTIILQRNSLYFTREQLVKSKYYNFTQIRTFIKGKVLINNEYVCKQDNPFMIVIVPSKPEHSRERDAVRATYGSVSRDKVDSLIGVKIDKIVRLVFVLGKTENVSTEKDTLWENEQYRDIIKFDMVDSYYNLSLKMLHALNWINNECNNVQYVLKADDDVFVNLPLLLHKLSHSWHSKNGNVFGYIFNTSEHFKVQRERNTKWSVGYEEYPLGQYPPYAQGTSYTLTRNLVPKILHTAQYLPYLHVEDVFITGIIAGYIHGATLVHLNGSSTWGDPEPKPCRFVDTRRVAQHRMNANRMYKIWQALRSYPLTCRLYRTRKHT